jgi:hypothetical protein
MNLTIFLLFLSLLVCFLSFSCVWSRKTKRKKKREKRKTENENKTSRQSFKIRQGIKRKINFSLLKNENEEREREREREKERKADQRTKTTLSKNTDKNTSILYANDIITTPRKQQHTMN